MKKNILLFHFLLCFTILSAQQIPIGGWQEHLSYKNAISVAEGNGLVYCLTTSGIFNYRKSDNSMTRLSKVNGLSDIEGVVVNYNPYNNKFLIAYKNSNIDIIETSQIINISDIKRKAIIGNKSINNIYFINQFAYLSCGFGIVVLDTEKNEIKDTYYIGPLGASINVMDLTSDGTYFYAATETAIYRALVSNPNLANYTSWTNISNVATGLDLPLGLYNNITSFAGKIYTNYAKSIMTGAYGEDSLFVFDGITWSHFIPPFFTISGYNGVQIKTHNNQLVFSNGWAVYTFDSSITGTGYYSGYTGSFTDITRASAAVLDNAGGMWIADNKYGLVSWRPSIGYQYRYPNGPVSESVLNMSLAKNQLFVAPGGYAKYLIDGIYQFKEEQWNNVRSTSGGASMDSIYDIMNVLVDPNDPKRLYASTWGQGVLELYNGTPVAMHNTTNTSGSLQGLGLPGYNPVWTYGLAVDEGGNLWVSGSGVNNSLCYKNTSGSWSGLNFQAIINKANVEQLLIDKVDQKWVVISNSGGGILVYKGNTTDAPSASNSKKLTITAGNGGLPSNVVYCLAEDLDDEIWVGTDKGIAVFYSPENVFSGSNFDAQQILLEQDGYVQILLETENVLSIAVDDANRKWIGTSNSGVYLMSADGTTQIQHFDISNSPLFSNTVKSITINHETGEVYFGTSKGIVSYRGTSIEAFEGFTDVYAFPNPVKHDYEGPIAIKGLMNNSTLKITDISGALVYEMKSEGGQAIWYGKNFKDERVSSGVYMVFCTSEDGAKKTVTKILVIN